MSIASEIRVQTPDGVSLSVHVFQPEGPPRGVVQINPATAVSQRLYRSYAEAVAGRGIVAITFDYRGTGDSCSIDDTAHTMADWGRQDIEAVIGWVAQEYPGLPHLCLAHSVGGQLLGLAPHVGKLDGVLAVCAQWGTWTLWPGWRRHQMRMLYWTMQNVTRVVGRFPGARVGAGDLPRGIGLEWMRWCLSPHYICDDDGSPMRPHNADLTCPVHFIGFSDDGFFAPEPAVAAMQAVYPNAPSGVQMIDAEQVGGKVGHFGFFRRRFADSLWDASFRWFDEILDGPPETVPEHLHFERNPIEGNPRPSA